jgi:hypothetical protein
MGRKYSKADPFVFFIFLFDFNSPDTFLFLETFPCKLLDTLPSMVVVDTLTSKLLDTFSPKMLDMETVLLTETCPDTLLLEPGAWSVFGLSTSNPPCLSCPALSITSWPGMALDRPPAP